MRTLIAIILLLPLTACMPTMKLSKSREFVLSKDTPITVNVQNDYYGIQGKVESKLLDLGLNVVPMDIARKSVELKTRGSVSNVDYSSISSLENKVYIPSAILLSISCRAGRNFFTYFDYFNARFLDLSSQRVLGVASFSQGADWVSVDHTLDSFARELTAYIK